MTETLYTLRTKEPNLTRISPSESKAHRGVPAVHLLLVEKQKSLTMCSQLSMEVSQSTQPTSYRRSIRIIAPSGPVNASRLNAGITQIRRDLRSRDGEESLIHESANVRERHTFLAGEDALRTRVLVEEFLRPDSRDSMGQPRRLWGYTYFARACETAPV